MTSQSPIRRIYIDPAKATAGDIPLDIDHLRWFYGRNNIEITTDPADSDLNTRDDRTQDGRAAWLKALRESKQGIRREKTTGPRQKAEPATGKICTTCGEHKLFDQFVVSPKGRILWTCTACFSARINATDRNCPRCGETKPLSKFDRSANSVGGRTRSCSACRSRTRTERRQAEYRAKGIPGNG